MKKFAFLLVFVLFATNVFTQDLTLREQKIQEEQQNITLLGLPPENEMAIRPQNSTIPIALDIDSEEIVKKRVRTLPNNGDPYFILSGGLAPYQASIGILKYFIPEWWGQIDLMVSFIPTDPVDNYYTAFSEFGYYGAFRVVTGYSFFEKDIYEISVIAQFQFVFIGTDDIPMLPSLGMRFIFDWFYLDVGVSYALEIGSTNLVFSGWYPAVTIGVRF